MSAPSSASASAGRSLWRPWWALILVLAAFGTLCASCGGVLLVGSLWLPSRFAPAFARATATTPPTATPPPTPTVTATPDLTAREPFRAVVQVVALDAADKPLWTGSGSVISPEGLILTNAHIALPDAGEPAPASLLILQAEQEDRPPQPRFYAEVVQADRALDLAILRITRDTAGNPLSPETLNLPYLPLGRAADLRLGDELTILGYPGIGGNTITLTKGEVAGFIEEAPYGPRALIKTTATLAGGNSGGAALNARGELVAVPTRFGVDADEVVDCRVLVDTNHDGVVDEDDACVPIGGFINALRPVDLAQPLVDAARRGEIAVPTLPPTATVSALDGWADLWRHPGPRLDYETFDVPVAGWAVEEDYPTADVHFIDGAMFVRLREPKLFHSFTSPVEAADVVVKAQVRVSRRVPGGDFGLVCRYQDLDHFYSVAITEDGYYYVWKMLDGEPYELHPPAPLPPEAAFRPDHWNEMGMICFGPHLVLWVNEHPVVVVSDASLRQPGDAGLFVGTFDRAGFEVAFDDFEVRAARR